LEACKFAAILAMRFVVRFDRQKLLAASADISARLVERLQYSFAGSHFLQRNIHGQRMSVRFASWGNRQKKAWLQGLVLALGFDAQAALMTDDDL
jgi:ABC-type sulfate transport system substrate-binding protein